MKMVEQYEAKVIERTKNEVSVSIPLHGDFTIAYADATAVQEKFTNFFNDLESLVYPAIRQMDFDVVMEFDDSNGPAIRVKATWFGPEYTAALTEDVINTFVRSKNIGNL